MATIRKNKKKRIIIAVVIAVIIVAIVAGVCAKVVVGSIPEVKLCTVGTSDIYETVSATGTVSSGAVKEYKVGAVATVKDVKVKVGDVVKQGDVLATFDTSGYDSEISKLQSSYNQAKSAYNSALESQKEAKKNLAAVQKQIAALEKENAKLKKEAGRAPTSTAPSVTRPSNVTLPSNVTRPSVSVTIPSTAAASSVAPSVSNTLPSFTFDMPSNIPTTGVPTSNVNSGNNIQINPDIVSGIDINDINAVANAVSNSNASLSANEVMLAAYQIQEQLYSSMASDSVVSAQKEVMDTTKQALLVMQDAQQEMAAGWTAAFDGTITECNIFPGEQTSLLSAGITLQNLNNMVVTISLGEYDIHKVKVDMPATITTAYGEYSGRVISKAPVATGSSASSIMDSVGSSMGISGLSSLTQAGAGVEVQITVDNPDEYIIVGFDANVEIAVGEHIGITTVPSNAMLLDKTGFYVFVYDEKEKVINKTLIETGASSISEYEVVSGVKVGDRIVLAPQSTFEDSFDARIADDE